MQNRQNGGNLKISFRSEFKKMKNNNDKTGRCTLKWRMESEAHN